MKVTPNAQCTHIKCVGTKKIFIITENQVLIFCSISFPNSIYEIDEKSVGLKKNCFLIIIHKNVLDQYTHF